MRIDSETQLIKMETPELNKIKKVSEDSQKIGDFLSWLFDEKGLCLGKYPEGKDRLQAVGNNIPDLLADYFKIDEKKAEEERRAILKEYSEKNTN